MNIKQYSKDVCEYIDNLTDEEFDELLLGSGIENCPYEDIDDEAKIEQWVTILKDNYGEYNHNNMYKQTNYRYSRYSTGILVA